MGSLRTFLQRQPPAVHLLVAGVWAVTGLIAWLVALVAPLGWYLPGSVLTVLAASLALLTSLVRWAPIAGPSRSAPAAAAEHLRWLGGVWGSLGWLGFCLLAAVSLVEAMPAMLLLTCAEAALLFRGLHEQRLDWLGALPKQLWNQLNQIANASSPPADSADAQFAGGPNSVSPSRVNPNSASPNGEHEGRASQSPAAAQTTLQAADAVAQVEAAAERELELDADAGDTSLLTDSDGLDENVWRQTVDGIDEGGQRYLSGDVRVAMQGAQQTETIVVSFCPAFDGQPEVDLECESEEITARVLHCTPAGMRIALRRARSLQAASFTVQWYAAQTTDEALPPTAARQALP